MGPGLRPRSSSRTPPAATVGRLNFRRNRLVDASTVRFTTVDPIGVRGGLGVYTYAGGDPINFLDPMGANPILGALAIGARIAAAAIGRWVAAAAIAVGGWILRQTQDEIDNAVDDYIDDLEGRGRVERKKPGGTDQIHLDGGDGMEELAALAGAVGATLNGTSFTGRGVSAGYYPESDSDGVPSIHIHFPKGSDGQKRRNDVRTRFPTR
ncbi:MAG: hypothetical protein LCH84_15245 [Gemmatimonadetes bacterium]|nr:hypothetical protein [Gemmatimonadota bacterium]